MKDTKDSIPPTHLTPDNYLKCPRCNNDKLFTILIQYLIKDGIPAPSSITTIEELAEWSDYNTIICDACGFYLTWGGVTWREVDGVNAERKKPMSKEEVLKSIPLEVLEQMLKERMEPSS